MKKFIKEHNGLCIFIAGIIFNLLESLYFGIGTDIGFNLKPQSIAEFICDDISLIAILIGGYLMGLKLANRYKDSYSKGFMDGSNGGVYINSNGMFISSNNIKSDKIK